jgi:ectoine hydroxylase-related dioxygenase (phytanoyl-CoA dioxygenase family)
MLSQAAMERYRRDGYLVVEDAVTPGQLADMRREMEGWVEESRHHSAPFGQPTIDGRPRFDLGAEHSPDHPALRRVNNPSDVSPAFEAVMTGAPLVDMVADLIGPDVKFHHCKVNLKLSGTQTVVGYHQDFAYTPHSNDDIVTALIMLDDMTLENGCLMVVPGSHTGPIHTLFEGERFTGYVQAEVEREAKAHEVPVTGKAGGACLMHTRLLHGSAANRSPQPRGLYICVFTAADAVPLAHNPMPNPNEGRIVRGTEARSARLMNGIIELPQQPKMASFFAVQEQAASGRED